MAQTPISRDEFLAQAKPLNPAYSDAQIGAEYEKLYPPPAATTEAIAPLPFEEFLAQAKPLNPGYSDEQIRGEYEKAYPPTVTPPRNTGFGHALVEGATQGMYEVGASGAGTLERLQDPNDPLKKFASDAGDALMKEAQKHALPSDVAAQPWYQRLTTKEGLGALIGNLAVQSAPSLAGAAAGGAIGSVVPGVGTAIGAAVGMLGTTYFQQAGSTYRDAFQRYQDDGLEEHAAHEKAYVTSGLAGLTSGIVNTLAVPASLVAPFTSKLKNLALNYVLNVAVDTGDQATQNVVAKATYKPEQDLTEGIPEAAIGSALLGSAETTGVIRSLVRPTRQEETDALLANANTVVQQDTLDESIRAAHVVATGGTPPPAGETPAAPTDTVNITPVVEADALDQVIAQQRARSTPLVEQKIEQDNQAIAVQQQTDANAQTLDVKTKDREDDRTAFIELLSEMRDPATRASFVTTDPLTQETHYKGEPVRILDVSTLPPTLPADASGISQETHPLIEKFTQLLGKKLVVVDKLPGFDGVVWGAAGDNRVYIAQTTKAADPFSVVKHELMHTLEGTPLHDALREVIWENKTPEYRALAKARHSSTAAIKDTKTRNYRLLNEVTADVGSAELDKQVVWDKVFARLGEQVGDAEAHAQGLTLIDTIKEMLAKIKQLIVSNPWTTNQHSIAERMVTDLTKVHDALAAAVADAIQTNRTKTPQQLKEQQALMAARQTPETPGVVHPEAVAPFQALADAHRGAPESAMLDVTQVVQGGPLSPVVEQVGTLLHHMTARAGEGSANTQVVAQELDRAIASLTHADGFEKEQHAHLANMARRTNRPVDEVRTNVDGALLRYAEAFKPVPVYNRPQWLARAAAVAIGEQRFPDAVAHLKTLRTLANPKTFTKEAFATTRTDGALTAYLEPIPTKMIGTRTPGTTGPLHHLEIAIAGHPAGSTLSAATLRELGYRPVPTTIISKRASTQLKKAEKQKQVVAKNTPAITAPPAENTPAITAPPAENVAGTPTPVLIADLHDLAEARGIPFDNDRKFMDLTERTTGKRHLDDLTQDERVKMADKIKETPLKEVGAQTLVESSSVGHPIALSNDLTADDRAFATQYDNAPLLSKRAVPAWDALRAETERLYGEIMKKVTVQRVTGQPYPDAESMNADIKTGTFKVTTDHSDHPVWSVEDNVKFRVVHDYIGHFETGFDFTLEGERQAYEHHASQLQNDLAKQALKVEVYGQAAAAIAHDGEFQPQKIFLPNEGPSPSSSLQDRKNATKTLLQTALANGELPEGAAFRGASVAELAEIVRTGQLSLGTNYEGAAGISASLITPKEEGFALYGDGTGYIVDPFQYTDAGFAGEVSVDPVTDPNDVLWVHDGKILSFAALTRALKAPASGPSFSSAPAPMGLTKAQLPKNAQVPNVQWDKDPLRRNIEQIQEDWRTSGWGKGTPTVYQAYIAVEDFPRPRSYDLSFEMGGYDWKGYKKSNTFPPATIVIHENGIGSQLADGNHRVLFWKEMGFTHFPTWVVDFRKNTNRRTNPPRVSSAPESNLGFYSQVENVLEQKMPTRASFEQIKGILSDKNGVKPDELKWLGIDEFLKTKDVFTKPEVMTFVAQHRVDVSEVMKGSPTARTPEQQDKINEYHTRVQAIETLRDLPNDHPDHMTTREGNSRKSTLLSQLGLTREDLQETVAPTKYATYQTPGGDNYRELLLTLPPAPVAANAVITVEPFFNKNSGTDYHVFVNNVFWKDIGFGSTEAALTNAKRQWAEKEGKPTTFNSSHFDEPNILAHVRFNDREVDGQKTLFIEEVQSDWHQQGRQRGYAQGDRAGLERELAAILPDVNRALTQMEYLGFDSLPEARSAIIRDGLDTWETNEDLRPLLQRYIDLYHARTRAVSGIPDAPFKKTWHELAMKRMLRYAAEHGYDRLAWTTGAMQAERYDLSKQIDSIDYKKYTDGTFAFHIYKADEQLAEKLNQSQAEVEAFIGKEMLAKMNAEEGAQGATGWRTLSGIDLKVGGEGMKGFYDQIVPSFMNKYTKKWGARVERVNLQEPNLWHGSEPLTFAQWIEADLVPAGLNAEEKRPAYERYLAEQRTAIDNEPKTYPTSVHAIPITDAMRESVVQEGQPLFSAAGVPEDEHGIPQVIISQPGKLDSVIRLLQDKNIDIKRVVEDVQKTGRTVPETINPIYAEEAYEKRVDQQSKDFLNDEFKPVLDSITLNKGTVEQVNAYLHARHVIADDVNATMQDRRPDLVDQPSYDKLSGLTDDEASTILAKAPVWMKAVATRIDEIVETTRDLMVQYGSEKETTIAGWRQDFRAYVPLRREAFEDEGRFTGTGRSVRGSTVRARGGSELAVSNILANIANDREQVITRGEKMRPVVAFAAMLMQHPLPGFAKLDKLVTVTETDPVTGEETVLAQNLGDYQIPMVRRYDQASGTMKLFPDPMYKGRDHVVNFRVKGNEYAIVFHTQNVRAREVAAAFKSLGTPQLSGILQAIAPFTRALAAVNTQYNPIFGLVNFVRDTQFAMLTLGSTPLAGKQSQILRHALGNIAGIYADARAIRAGKKATSEIAKSWQHFEHVGGPSGYRDLFFTTKDRANEIQRLMDPTAWSGIRSPQQFGARLQETALFGWLSDYNLAMENSIRLAVFQTAVASGVGELQAMSLAKNATVNFGKKGQLGAQAGSLYAFFNANVQGSARIAETLFERTPDRVGFRLTPLGKKIIAGGILLGILQAFALSMAGLDDDEPPEFVKQKNLVFPVPGTGKGYVQIPMPLGFNLLPNVGRLMAETLMRGITGKPSHIIDKTASLFGAMYSTLSPLGGTGGALSELLPTVVDPIGALATNTDFTGRSISKVDYNPLKPTPGHTRYHDTATAWAKALSYAINYATGGTDYVPGVASPTPDAVDYFVGQITGGVGREAGKLAQIAQGAYTGEEVPLHKIPVLGRFVGSAGGAAAVRGQFYANVKAVNTANEEWMGRINDKIPAGDYLLSHPEARFAKTALKFQEAIGELNTNKKRLIARGASRDAIRLEEERIAGLMTRFNGMVEQAQH